jgi:hypothetical protein
MEELIRRQLAEFDNGGGTSGFLCVVLSVSTCDGHGVMRARNQIRISQNLRVTSTYVVESTLINLQLILYGQSTHGKRRNLIFG